jgi:putative ABC transport system ATP-binding protein
MNLLELKNVSYSYPDGKSVLQGIDLEIIRKDLIIIQGESGTGKSTFLKLFNRFCDPGSGSILLNNKELYEYGIDKIRSSIIYLPQLPFMIDGTVEENLSFPFSFHSHKAKQYDPEKAAEWLDYFQLDIPPDNEALKLSTGQKQRIALIRAMLLDPDVLLLDEPGSSLDSGNKKLIDRKIEALIESSGISVIMATHGEIGFTEGKYRLFRLENGRLVQ